MTETPHCGWFNMTFACRSLTALNPICNELALIHFYLLKFCTQTAESFKNHVASPFIGTNIYLRCNTFIWFDIYWFCMFYFAWIHFLVWGSVQNCVVRSMTFLFIKSQGEFLNKRNLIWNCLQHTFVKISCAKHFVWTNSRCAFHS